MKTEHNHYIKKTILLNWLIDDKFYYFDKTDSILKDLGKNKADTQFTSLLINKNTENIINTNKIENDFENTIKNYVCYGNFINPKLNIPSDKLEKIREMNHEKIFGTSVDYFSLQITREPKNIYKYLPIFHQGVIEQSFFFQFLPLQVKNELLAKEFKKIFDEKPESYQMLFDMVRSKINEPHEFYLIAAKDNIFHLSEGNTTSLFNLVNINNDFNIILTKEQLENSYVTAISPKLLLILNCNADKFIEEDIIPLVENIEFFWTSFVVNSSFEKIILANKDDKTIEKIKKVLNNCTKIENLSDIFKANEAIYKKYYL